MDAAYEDLKKKGFNNVDNLVQWMKEAKVIESVKEKEDNARKLFEDCADKTNVELVKFKQVLTQLATEQKKTADDFTSMLCTVGPQLYTAFEAAAKAFKEALK